MKNTLIAFAKVGISLGIVAFLLWQARGHTSFTGIYNDPKDWGLLGLAFFFTAAGVTLSFVRWQFLVRAMGLPFSLGDALRLGFVGYLFNLAPMGIVGGDLLKAILVAREHPENKAKAVASVVVDRIIGLYILFVVAFAASFLSGFWRIHNLQVQTACWATWIITAVSTLVVACLLTPAFTDGPWARYAVGLPRVGPHLEHVIDAVRRYRRNPRVLLLAAAITVVIHCSCSTGIYCVSRGLGLRPDLCLPLAMHYVIYPVSAATGVIPLMMGPLEVVLNILYSAVPLPDGTFVESGRGLALALVYRIITVLVAAIGVCYYLASRREIAQSMQEAQREEAAV